MVLSLDPFETSLPMPTGRPLPLYAQLAPGARRGVVIVHEIFGRQPEIDRVVQRLAAAGYAAVAPDLFHGAGKIACLREALRTMQTGQGPFVERIRAARTWLCEQTGLPEDAIGLIGFCLGGGFALAAGSGFAAVSSNYGDIPPTGVMRGIGPVIACYGGRDVPFRNKPKVLRERLAPLGIEPEVHVFPQAGHAFLTDGHHPVAEALLAPLLHVKWNPQVAEQGWQRILAFFEQNLGS
jgi:carboxymethylenebutenolidase